MGTLRHVFSQKLVKKNRIFLCMSCETYSTTTAERKSLDSTKCDIIGPPNKVSNLRPIMFHVPKDESPVERGFRLKREEVQKWNEEFWANHNTNFFEQKNKFVSEYKSKQSSDDSPMTSDEISVFYKRFLDENWRTHQSYNVEWYCKNFSLLVLALRVVVFKALRRIGFFKKRQNLET